MRLKAIVASAMTALALCGVLASSAAASIVLTPSPQEMAEHPGEGYSATCDMSEQESRDSQFTDEYVNKANAEGKCTGQWTKEPASTNAPEATGRKSKADRSHHKHRKAHRHTRR
ncbi:MAG TPA: hypothetical protein VMS60_06505 [Solirubrobacterales bacterium]|nr:hypothetical protein [Solirubrobacterales bacterium]